MLPICAKCNKALQNKEILKCSKCKQAYDIQCSGRSSKLFQLMSTERKKTWICQPCHSSSSAPSQALTKKSVLIKNNNKQNIKLKNNNIKSLSPISGTSIATQEPENNSMQQYDSPTGSASTESMLRPDNLEAKNIPNPSSNYHTANSTPSRENVTLRKAMQIKKCQLHRSLSDTELTVHNSLDSLASNDSDDLDAETMLESYIQNRSLPDIKTDTEETLREYKILVNSLELKLQSSELEIQNLILENGTLKAQIQENEQTIKKLTHICTSTSKKLKSKLPKKGIEKTKLILNQSQKNEIGHINASPFDSSDNRLPREEGPVQQYISSGL
ncbi:uncharacterized protein [Choristoneura fumiferana]|uniref:uncharacterized protein n=1 Tax=Choristoneura fumiferana TaxID=7141 RepID=UPI003D1538EB